ncbi:unnamed protein product [Somion occarium]|uniref:Steroid 5-alpha reductase C-terminal domain-containing protein n=1 Tax=Somion occarium TaxID=3059160 RepID=A0ABP1E9E3_9APHY
MVSVTISSAHPTPLAKELPITIGLPDKTLDNATIGDVKAAVTQKFPKFDASRQKITLKGDRKALSDETTLRAAALTDSGELTVKDLGPQIRWRTVFIWEYAGPLFIHTFFYYFPNLFYGGPVQHSLLQRYVYVMTISHFLKREYETLFVHRFSNGTMPLFGLFRNCAHYWILAGVSLAYAVYGPAYATTSPYIRGTIRSNPTFLWSCIAVWIFAEISNYRTHAILRDLRPAGTKERRIPYGYGFNLVSCPNYFFELIGWATISVMTGSYAGAPRILDRCNLYSDEMGDKEAQAV